MRIWTILSLVCLGLLFCGNKVEAQLTTCPNGTPTPNLGWCKRAVPDLYSRGDQADIIDHADAYTFSQSTKKTAFSSPTTIPKFIIDPGAVGGYPTFSAPFSMQGELSDTHTILFVPNMTIGTNTSAVTKGGINVQLGRDTPIALGKRGDFFAYSMNAISAQADTDRATDGIIAYGANITTTGGIRTTVFDAAVTLTTVAPPEAYISNSSFAKQVDGTTGVTGHQVSCTLSGGAVQNCGFGMAIFGAWDHGLDIETLAGSAAWGEYIRLVNNTTTNVGTGIKFGDAKVTIGIDMASNTIENAIAVEMNPTTFANINTGLTGNGTQKYCSDCVFGGNPCAGGGTGAIAKRLAAVWRCG